MFAAAAAALLVAMGMALVRALMGPTVYDRILAANAVGTKTLLLIAVVGYMTERPEFMDIALVYALINFIGTVAVTKFVRYRSLGHPVGDASEGEL